MQSVELMQSPETYIHECNYYGKAINPIKLNLKWKEYTSQVYARQLIQACKASGSIAVHASYLTRREKQAYENNRYYSQKKVYYLFPADRVPLSIYNRIADLGDRLIYEKMEEE